MKPSNPIDSSAMALVTIALLAVISSDAFAAKCLYVSSYHKGYEWNDGIERGLDTGLKGKCTVDKIYMDAKRHPDDAFGKQMAIKVKEYIDSTKPDVVIACDDPASKYLVAPYYKDAMLPIVFCGINWTAEPYGYPYSNVTGMIEISPIQQLSAQVVKIQGNIKHGIFLGSDDISQQKEAGFNQEIYKKAGIRITPILARTMSEWEDGFRKAQNEQLLIVGNYASIADWDADKARNIVNSHVKVLTVSNYDWMAPYVMLAMTKVAEEQGEWSARTALTILGGRSPKNIPIVVNRQTNIFVNPSLLKKAGIKLPAYLMQKGIKAGEPN